MVGVTGEDYFVIIKNKGAIEAKSREEFDKILLKTPRESIVGAEINEWHWGRSCGEEYSGNNLKTIDVDEYIKKLKAAEKEKQLRGLIEMTKHSSEYHGSLRLKKLAERYEREIEELKESL